MKKQISLFRLTLITLLFMACNHSKVTEPKLEEGWTAMNRVAKKVGNITYIFPADVEVELRDSAIRISERCIQENLELVEEEAFTDTIKFEFFYTRAEMKLTAGYGVKGLAMPHLNAMYSLMDLSGKSPIQHELMHMIAMLNWQRPYNSMQWANEGLATYAGKICGEDNFAEVYYYMLTHNLLISQDDLVNNFYNQNEVMGYTQSAYIVKYLSDNYGWDKVKTLWRGSFSEFETIFGLSYETIQAEMHQKLAIQFPDGVELDWENFKKGCPDY